MIATDLQPLSVVEDKGFVELMKVMDSRYTLLSRHTVTSSHLQDIYKSVKIKLQAQLNSVSHIALTTDIWTSRQTLSYCCVTAHFLTTDWELKSTVLETFEFSTEHTGDHIAQELLRVTSDWNVTDKIVCVVTDNASNMVLAISGKTPWRHLPCFAHSLNLVVQDSITGTEDIHAVQQRCKNIVSHFHRSGKSLAKLREVQ